MTASDDVADADPTRPSAADDNAESATTIAFAFAANLVIAIAKLIGGLVSGSVAMLAEAGHSFADSVNQIFLGVSLTLGSKPPDEDHPFGYGKERFFWAFLAAAFIFVAGAVFSWIEGIRAFFGESEDESFPIAYVVLAVALVAESVSLARALRQTRNQAAAEHRSISAHLRLSKDPTVKVVVVEDSAAVVGLLIAALGIGLHQITGDHRWDAIGSIAIGCLLAFVAYRLGHDTKDCSSVRRRSPPSDSRSAPRSRTTTRCSRSSRCSRWRSARTRCWSPFVPRSATT